VTSPVLVREEQPADLHAIHAVNAAAFETDAEARLVDALRASAGLILSLVAEVEGELVGHIAFSTVTVTRADGTTAEGVALGPVAVVPARQRAGIGGQLIADGLRRLREAGHPFCIVLGHPEYYPRHGFVRASTHGLAWDRRAPDEAFMVQELAPRRPRRHPRHRALPPRILRRLAAMPVS
jgi:putative acetyltransferase